MILFVLIIFQQVIPPLSQNFYQENPMLQWKHLQLSSQDYQNYINNEDEQSIKINDLNIQEWQELYHLMQKKSLTNKSIKKSILTYENNMMKLSGESNIFFNPKELQKHYQQYNSELKTKLSDLYYQLGMLHLKNISTTVQLIVSRLLSIEEEFFNLILQNNIKIQNLQHQLLEAEVSRKKTVCSECSEHFQKIRNKYLKSQIIAGEEPDSVVQQAKNRNAQSQKIRKYMREQIKLQEHQYDVQRYNYMNSVQQALKNRDKTLRFSNSPLQNILTDYLHEMLAMLQAKKLNYAPKGINEFDRVNRSYETLEDMKKLFKNEQFMRHISKMLSQPISNFSYKIEQQLKSCLDRHKGTAVDSQTQTIFVNQFDLIKNLQKHCSRLTEQIQAIRASKIEMENDILQNLQISRKYQTKMSLLSNKNKQLQTDNKKLELQVNQLQIKLQSIHFGYKSQKANMIETMANEKSSLINEKKRLEAQLKKVNNIKNGIKINTADQEIQTQYETFIEFLKEHEKLKKGNFKKRTQKKVSIRLLEQINQVRNSNNQHRDNSQRDGIIKSTKAATMSPIKNIISAGLSHQSKLSIKTGNSNNLAKIGKASKQAISLKVSRVNPLKPPYKEQFQCAINQLKLRENFTEEGQLIHQRRSHQKLKNLKKNGPLRGRCYNRSQFTGREPQRSIQSDRSAEVSQLVKNLFSSKVIPFSRFKEKENSDFSSHTDFKGKVNEDQQKQIITQPLSQLFYHKQSATQLIFLGNQGQCSQDQQIIKDQAFHITKSIKEKKILSQFVNLCIAKYQNLQKTNAFKLFKEEALKMREAKQPKKDIRSSYQQATEKNHESKSMLCEKPPLDKKNVEELFISVDISSKFERNDGIWAELDGCLMVDNHFSAICDQIQNYFNELKTKDFQRFKQYLIFLSRPHSFLKQKNLPFQSKKQHFTQQMFSRVQTDANWIKNLFKRLYKVHKILHKRCNHIQDFLQHIGFPSK